MNQEDDVRRKVLEQLRTTIAEAKRLATVLHGLETDDRLIELQKALTLWYGATDVGRAAGDPDGRVH